MSVLLETSKIYWKAGTLSTYIKRVVASVSLLVDISGEVLMSLIQSQHFQFVEENNSPNHDTILDLFPEGK